MLLQQLFKFLSLFRRKFRPDVVANFLQFLLHLRIEQVPDNLDSCIALSENLVDAIGYVPSELQLFLKLLLKALLGKNGRDRRLWRHRPRHASFHKRAAYKSAGGENHYRRENDFPDFHQASSDEPALANTAVSNS